MIKKDNLKIAGVVTLYNPTDKDISNINTYIDDISKLYVVDNTEGHDNKVRLPKNKKIEYIFNNENIGVAAALNLGAKNAIKGGYDWLLTMDQDTTFKPGVFTELKKVITTKDMDNIGIVTPWHNTKLIDKRPTTDFDYPGDVMTSGNLLNLDIYKKIGGFKDWMFIDGIDIEYCLNLRSHGYKILRDDKVAIDHNLGNLFYKSIRGRLFLCMNHPAVRRYYIMRNYHYILDLYKEFDPSYCYSLCSQRHNMLGVLLFEKDKYRKLRNYIRGYNDYKKGIKGKYPYKN
jgi:rhamnosyltransferase